MLIMKKFIVIILIIFGLFSSFTISNKNLNQTANKITLKFKLVEVAKPFGSVLGSASIYGFVGIQVFKVSANKTELINSFGNKTQYFFNTTEDKSFPNGTDYLYVLPESPNYIREFLIPTNDWNNPSIQYEVRLWHHLKGKRTGKNYDYSKYSRTYDLKKLMNSFSKKVITVSKTSKSSSATFTITKY